MVGVGVMDYNDSNDDRRQADQLHASYVEKMKSFVLWLVDNGRSVRMFTTDVHDERIMGEVIAHLRAHRPSSASRYSQGVVCYERSAWR